MSDHGSGLWTQLQQQQRVSLIRELPHPVTNSDSAPSLLTKPPRLRTACNECHAAKVGVPTVCNLPALGVALI